MRIEYKKLALFIVIFFTSCFLILSCSSNSENKSKNSSNSSSKSNNDEESENTDEQISDCKYNDGTYSAKVDYNNSETGYSSTYTLDVEIENCQVIQIDFPNGGYLNEDHITAADLDEDGNASVEGESGKTYEVKIDN